MGEKGAWAYKGTAKSTSYYIGNGLQIGRYFHRVHSNKSPFLILEKREHGRIQELSKFWRIQPIISGTKYW